MPLKRPSVFTTTIDMYGKYWDVGRRHPTPYGFAVDFGWPVDYAGPGAARAILTPPLADYLRRVERSKDIDLPLTNVVQSRFRRELGMDYRSQRERWWRERIDDLQALSHREFAHRHAVSEVAVTEQFVRRFGPRKRPPRWYREPAIAQMLLTLTPREAAARLDIHLEAAATYRKVLRRHQRKHQLGTS